MIDFGKSEIEEETLPAPVAAGKRFDLKPLKIEFEPYLEMIDRMGEAVDLHHVRDDESLKTAVTMAGQAITLNREIEALRKKFGDPYLMAKRAIDAFAKSFTENLAGITERLKGKIEAFQIQRELDRRVEEKKAEEEMKALQADINEQARAAGVEAPEMLIQVRPEPDNVTRSETASAHLRENLDFEVVNIDEVPRVYWTLDFKEIRKAIKAGVRVIPGLRIFPRVRAVIRT